MPYNNSTENIKSKISNEELKIEYDNKNNFMEAYFSHAELTTSRFLEEIFSEAIDEDIMVSDNEFKNGKANGKMLIYSPELSKTKYKSGNFIKLRKKLVLTQDNIYDINIEGYNGILVSTNLHYGINQKSDGLAYFLNFDIDFDGIYTASDLTKLTQMFEDNKILTPTLLLSTGTGVHLIYRLKKPIRVYEKKNIQVFLSAIKSALCLKLSKIFFPNNPFAEKIKPLALDQNIRCTGSTTKLGEMKNNLEDAKKDVVKAWKIGNSYKLTDLIEYVSENLEKCMYVAARKITYEDATFNTSINELQEEVFEILNKYIDFEKINESIPKPVKTIQYGNKKYNFVNKNVYNGWLNKCKMVAEGNRYYALLGLVAYALKSNVSEEELLVDLKNLKKYYNKRDESKITNDDINSVISSFKNDENLKFLKGKTIAKRCGLEIKENKRNYRTQEEHLKLARVNAGRKSKKEELLNFLKTQKDKGVDIKCLSIREIEDLSGISKTTVAKYKQECLSMLLG